MREADGNNPHQPAWTCKVGSTGRVIAVADVRLCVRGVGGLKVADASLMLKVLVGHIKMLVKMLSVIERLQISPVGSERDS
jgi:choline dehydrogenase-like flavoprotein